MEITLDLIRELDIDSFLKHRGKDFGTLHVSHDDPELENLETQLMDSFFQELTKFTHDGHFTGSILPPSRWAEAETERLFGATSKFGEWLTAAMGTGYKVRNWALCMETIGKVQYIRYVYTNAMSRLREKRPEKRAQIIYAHVLCYNGVTITNSNQAAHAASGGFTMKASGKSLRDAWADVKQRRRAADATNPTRSVEEFEGDLNYAAAALAHPLLSDKGREAAQEHMRLLLKYL